MCPESLTHFFDCPRGMRCGGEGGGAGGSAGGWGGGGGLLPSLFSFFINELTLDVAKNGL